MNSLIKKDELKYLKKELVKEFSKVNNLFLVLTYRCNLRCKYCFITQSFKQESNFLSFATAKKGIDLWIEHVKEHVKNSNRIAPSYSIIFYGGEPLLNIETFIKTLEYLDYIKKRKENAFLKYTYLSLDTNGSLINNQVVKILKKYKVNVNITLDGPQKIHDYYRVDKYGKGTFKKVIESLARLKKAKINTRISVTVSPLNIEYLQEIFPIFLKYQIKEFTFIPLTDFALFILNPKINIKEYREKSAKKIIQAFKVAKKLGLREYRLEKKLRAFREEKFFLTDCGGYGNQIVILPNGTISNCPATSKYPIGTLDTIDDKFRVWNTSLIKSWRKRLPIYNPKCLRCKAISICGGGCPWVVDITTGNIFNRDESNCVFIKNFFKFLTSSN